MKEELKPELKNFLASYILTESCSKQSDRELSRMKATILYRLIEYTRPLLALKFSERPDLLFNK